MKERTEVDAEGEDTGEVNVRKYVIKSSKQREFEIVNVPHRTSGKRFRSVQRCVCKSKSSLGLHLAENRRFVLMQRILFW